MSNKGTSGPAFPCWEGNETEGMSIRDYFAAKAMQGYIMDEAIARDSDNGMAWLNKIAKASYEMADAMITAKETE
jgi:hypothetical protein